MKQVRILVFPCGSEIGLELHRSLKDIRFIDLYGGSSVEDHGCVVYKNYIGGIPFVNDAAFIEQMNRCIDENQIDFIFPAMDNVLAALSSHRDDLHAKLLTCPDETVQPCRSKAKTYARLAGCDFLPGVYASAEDVPAYPVIIKPAQGQGAQGVMILEDAGQLRHELTVRQEEQVICEYLPGEEYTVDCFTDRHGVLRYTSCRNRHRIKSGISVNSSLQPPDGRVLEIARKINEKMDFRGVWFFQLKKNAAGQYRLLECATRVAGTMCVERAAGINLPLLTVFDALDYDVDIPAPVGHVVVDRALHNVFKVDMDYDEVYMDFDDTLIVHGRVNFTVLQFIYQCVERQIPVILLTRHDTDVMLDLRAHCIAPELFQRIVCLPRSERKIDHVHPTNKALFVDDSFAERRSMQEAYGVYALGVDAVEALLDWRQ